MTKIPWTDETWNFSGGCKPVSEGCLNCAAAKVAATRLKHHPLYEGLTTNGQWNGKIRLCTEIGRQDILEKPLHWRDPRMVFPCFMGDLFNLPFEFIAEVFLVAQKCPQHTFQFLTKRIERAAEFYKWNYVLEVAKEWGQLKNLWLGVSVENQKAADERIPILLQIPAAVRFVSVEPMLESVDVLIRQKMERLAAIVAGRPFSHIDNPTPLPDWVIIGCESGPKRRECKLEWVGDIVRHCKMADIKVFVKQLSINGKVSHSPKEWPEDLRVRDYPKETK